ncbi:MAG: hypothetical protein IPM29_28970 [Planctomycetes bacterium]|nr:hypothetical protein [Planctomycetota bacterium]
MFLIRKIGKFVRGKATLPQIVLATTLGAMLGFVPGFFLPQDLGGGFLQAPGLIVALLALVLVLNANLGLFGLTLLAAKLLSFVTLPIAVSVGRALIDGSLEGLFRKIVNAPVLHWFGLEHYATTGGLALGLPLGVVLGFVIWRGLHSMRVKLANVDERSPRFREITGKWWVRLLAWLFLGGGKGRKESWRELAERDRRGRPVRIAGLAVVAVLGIGLWVAQGMLGGAWFHRNTQSGLEQWNGATVDLAVAKLHLTDGRLELGGLAMADAENLLVDAFRARNLTVDLSTSELLAGHVVIDSLVSTEASSGEPRPTPGRRTGEPGPGEPGSGQPGGPTAGGPTPPPGDGRTIDDYIKDAETWKERLRTAAEWIERLTGGDEAATGESPEERDARIAREREVLGLVNLVASQLFDERPAVVVRQLAFDGLLAAALGDDRVDVRGTNLSSHPSRLDQPMELAVAARSGAFSFTLRRDPAHGHTPEIELRIDGLSVDALARQLTVLPLSGGTIDVRLGGSVDTGRPDAHTWIDLPLTVTLKGTSFVLDGNATPLDTLQVPIGLRGPLSAPRVSVDEDAFLDALVAQGRAELARQARAKIDSMLSDQLGGRLGGVGEQVGGLIDGSKTTEEVVDEAQRRATEAAREAAEREAERLRNQVPEGLRGLLPGGRRDGTPRR